jgi:hypothetical protein
MLPTHGLSAILLAILIGTGQHPGAPAPPSNIPGCLSAKDRKRVERARGAGGRLVVYADLAEARATLVWYCLSPWATSWDRHSFLGPYRPECSSIQEMLDAVECARSGAAGELAAWRSSGPKDDRALCSARAALEGAGAYLRYAQVDADRSKSRLGPAIPNQVKAVRESLEDCEAVAAKLLGEAPAASVAGCP